MWNQTAEGDEFVRELSLQLVEQFAPEELDVFDELYADYRRDPSPPVAGQGRDDALGSGLGEAIVAVTPAASAMVTAVISFVLAEVLKAAREEAGEKIKVKVKAVFNPKDPKKEVPLTKEQMEQVRKLAARQAMEFGLPREQAKQMALALVGCLAVE